MATQTKAPIRKVQAGALAGALATLIVFILGSAGIGVPDGVEAALTTVITCAVAYFVPSAPEETTIVTSDGQVRAAKDIAVPSHAMGS